MMRNYHFTVNIVGLEERLLKHIKTGKNTGWQVLEKDGKLLNESQVYSLIQKHKKLGHTVIPTCDNYDDKGHCKGHEQKQLQIDI